ncbi:MAG: Nramp family divalent metal transporter [Chloroflexia bacterium]
MTDKQTASPPESDEAAQPSTSGENGSAAGGTEDPSEQPKHFWQVLGPGLITGASDDDPSGIGTYSQAGASLGFATLWLALITFPLMAAVQFICARIGLVSGQGLAGVLRKHYPRALLYPVLAVLLLANTINAGVDIGAIAAAINLIVPIPIPWMIVPVALLLVALMFWGSYKMIERTFKWLTLALFAYIGAAFFAKPDWGSVLAGTFIPTLRFDSTFLAVVVAILGTTISPYLFFWQASQEVEEETSKGRTTQESREGATREELRVAAWDVDIGMAFSNVVMYFIILATGATLFKAGKTDIQTATDAAQALRPIAGDAAGLLLAVGLIGAGLLAVPVLTGAAAYAVAEGFGWNSGLDERPGRAKQFYAVIAGAMLVGMLINFTGISPVQALFWTAVLNGFLAPPLLVVIMLIANNRKVMGEHVNGRRMNALGWLTTALMFAAAVALVLTWLGK